MTNRGTSLLRSTDADEVSAYCGNFFFTHRISHLGDPRDFSFSLDDMPLGPVRISEIVYEADAAIQLGGFRSSYSFFLPVQGFVCIEHQKSTVLVDPSLGLVVAPREPVNLIHWSARTKALLVWFEEGPLENEIAAMLGRGVRRSVGFQAQVRTGTPDLAAWIELVRTVHRSRDLVRHSFVSASLSDSLVRGFLSVTQHEYREYLDRRVGAGFSPTLCAATELIDGNANLPLTPLHIAAHCNVDVRTLHAAFRKHLGTTPMEYLRSVRLQRIHADLRDSGPEVTVASIVHKWGVTHLGHFSAVYRSTFGVLPSETLRGT
ncbi:AraC family transcriptional regulator [Actinoplanes sp. TBRC 11911]|uniref:AraC family transcriptional regulator n=1 Tax=Actinoplanes sp. TBRC 11911 TaxID=2729386 RepID=UPI00145E605E|nr:AraC family transcriptional regulator [Actinoplanes sp. TBRC 11911]NMO53749.1 AraC family transcriptional regulator [Actinoplanes sp. TBRC 11911]